MLSMYCKSLSSSFSEASIFTGWIVWKAIESFVSDCYVTVIMPAAPADAWLLSSSVPSLVNELCYRSEEKGIWAGCDGMIVLGEERRE